MGKILEVKNLTVHIKTHKGVVQAVRGVDFYLNEQETLAVVGESGSGKSQEAYSIMGLLQSPGKVVGGSITFEGQDLVKIPGHKIVSMGMAHVPEGRRVFADMSVYENLLMGAYTRKDKNEIAQSLEMVYKRFPRLKERTGQRAGTLSGGEQQRVAIARAIAQAPPVILADEPTGNLDSNSTKEIMDILKGLHKEGRTVILITHDNEIAAQAKRVIKIRDGKIESDSGQIDPV